MRLLFASLMRETAPNKHFLLRITVETASSQIKTPSIQRAALFSAAKIRRLTTESIEVDYARS